MKTLLITLEEINFGKPAELKCLELFKELRGRYEVHIFAKNIAMTEVGEYLRMKGAQLHTPTNPLVQFLKEYDVLLALDDWGIINAKGFECEKKIRVSEKATATTLLAAIESEPVKKNEADMTSPSSSPVDELKTPAPRKPASRSKASTASKPSRSQTRRIKEQTGQGTKDSAK